MKRSNWVRLIAVILIISMLAAPVSAATNRGNDGVRTNGVVGIIVDFIRDIIRDIFDDWFDEPGEEEPTPTTPVNPTTPTPTQPGETEPEETDPTEPGETKPTQPGETEPEETDPTEPGETEPEEDEDKPETTLNLVEGYENTENGHLLRGHTYTLSQVIAQQNSKPATTTTANRFGTKLGNGLGGNSIGTGLKPMGGLSVMADDAEITISDTALVITYDENGNAVIENGKYVLGIVGGKYVTNVSANSDWGYTLSGTSSKVSATIWTITRQADGSYTVQDSNNEYLSVPGWNKATMSATPVYFSIQQYGSNTVLKQLNTVDEYCYLNALGSITSSSFGGWTEGSPICLYSVTTAEPEEPENPEPLAELIYFPVTMFNYNNGTTLLNDESILRNLTHQAEVKAGLKETWEGLYFSGGSPSATTYTYTTSTTAHSDLTWQQVMDGTYYADEACAQSVTVTPVTGSGAGQNYVETTVTAQSGSTSGTQYFIQYQNSGYYYKVNNNYYEITSLQFGNRNQQWRIGCNGTTYNVKGVYTLTIYKLEATTSITGYTLTAGDQTLATLDGTDLTAKVDMTLYTAGGSTTVTKPYAAWNWWSYKPDNNNSDNAQNKFYTGLVQDELVDGEIKFNVVEPGIFTFDSSDPTVTNDGIKDIYQNVGLPFVKNDQGFYTFDSDAHGTYFEDTTGDGKSDPSYGTSATDYFKMHFDYENTQGWAEEGGNLGYGDGSANLWAPYNTNSNDTGEGDIDYHFGMRADIPFSMTPNGRVKSTDDNSDPIKFTFKGDDDVWIFIDGHLVIDLGGIHNRIGATIDFADNTITYFRPESNNKTLPIGSFNNPEKYPLNEDGTVTVKLYNEGSTEGALGKTRVDFAADEEHTMSIFYLERGKGTSNCQIEFNLPMRDTLLITKDATMSWSEEQDKGDGDHDGTAPLTTKEQAAVDKLNFGFTLFKKNHDETAFTEVKNTNFFVQDKDGNVIATSSTDGNGKFYLKNGQTAKFMTDFPKEGVTYYVVEDTVPKGFLTPDYKYAGVATDGFEYIGSGMNPDGSNFEMTEAIKVSNASLIPEHELPMNAKENKSYEITAYGSIEAIDSLEFICVNYLNADLPNPTAIANEDIIVIDYGLPVQIDPLHNDLFRGNDIEIVAWGDETLTLSEKLDEHGFAIDAETTWTGEKVFLDTTDEAQAFDSGNVTFKDKTYAEYEHKNEKNETYYTYDRDTFEYELTEQLTEVEEINYIIKVTSTVKETVGNEEITKTACRYALGKIYIVPATIMYYEENFSDMITFEGAGWDEDFTVSNQNNVSPFQEPGVVGTVGDSTYGSDVAYLSDNGDSNGTYRFGDTTNKAIRFTYTFTGTGTSIFARTSALTGYMQVKIFAIGEDGQETLQSTTYRDTYWKDENKTDLDASGTLYNIPVFTEEFQHYGTYKVVCTVAKAGTTTAGNDKGSGNEFYLDGIRVMQPLNEDSDQDLVERAQDAYAADGESNLEVVTLRQKLITDYEIPFDPESGEKEENWPFAVLTDINGEIVLASDYISIGPKEEVYLSKDPNASNGQKVSFSLKYWKPEGLKLYMGMKAPFGTAKVHVGHDTYELKNAPDCYYDVTDNYESLVTETDEDGYEYYVVTYTFEAAESIVSLTNIKVVGQHEFSIVEDTNINVEGPEGGSDVEPNEP